MHDLQVCTDAEVYAASLGEYMEEIARYAALSSSPDGSKGSGSLSLRRTLVVWLSMARVDELQVNGFQVAAPGHYRQYWVYTGWQYTTAVRSNSTRKQYTSAVHLSTRAQQEYK